MRTVEVNRAIEDLGLGEFERFCTLCDLWDDRLGCIYRFGPYCLFDLELIDNRLHITKTEHLEYMRDKVRGR